MSLGESEYCLLYVKIADYSFVCYEVKNSQAWGLDTGAVPRAPILKEPEPSDGVEG